MAKSGATSAAAFPHVASLMRATGYCFGIFASFTILVHVLSSLATRSRISSEESTTMAARRIPAAVRYEENQVLATKISPSSPSIALFQNGKPVYMMHRSDIERRDAFQIAQVLKEAFDKFCVRKEVPVS